MVIAKILHKQSLDYRYDGEMVRDVYCMICYYGSFVYKDFFTLESSCVTSLSVTLVKNLPLTPLNFPSLVTMDDIDSPSFRLLYNWDVTAVSYLIFKLLGRYDCSILNILCSEIQS